MTNPKHGVMPIPRPPRPRHKPNPFSTLNRVSAKRSKREEAPEAHYIYGFADTDEPTCWLAQFDSRHRECEGRMDPCHLIDKQVLKRNGLHAIVWDRRLWKWGCRLHHDGLDRYFTVRIPRSAISHATELLAEEIGLEKELTRRFGERESEAAA